MRASLIDYLIDNWRGATNWTPATKRIVAMNAVDAFAEWLRDNNMNLAASEARLDGCYCGRNIADLLEDNEQT